MSEYAMVLLFSLSVPLALSFWPPLRFYKNIKALFFTLMIILFFYGGWDVCAVFRGHWNFNSNAVWGLRFINLPLEEVLFFVVIPFCCIFTWEALKYIKGPR